jgi:hypothetical protein
MTPSPADEEAGTSPLEAISALEQELSGRLSQTRGRAERLIARAERESGRGLDDARSCLPRICEELRQKTLEGHRRRAASLRDSWQGDRVRLLSRADDLLPRAVDRLVASFLDALKDGP